MKEIPKGSTLKKILYPPMFGGVIYVLYICSVKEINYGTSLSHRNGCGPYLRRTHSV